MKSIKTHQGRNIKFDKIVSEPHEVPKSAMLMDIHYDEKYFTFNTYRTKAGKLYIRYNERLKARKMVEHFNKK